MIWKLGIFKTRWLLNIHQFLYGTIKKCAFDIHLMQLEVIMGSKGQKHPYSFKPCHRCKCFFKVQSFNLCVSLSHQSCLVPCHHTIFILLVAKNPPGANDICIGSLNKSPYLISLKVVELFLHSQDPILIRQCLFYLIWFNRRNKRKMLTKTC